MRKHDRILGATVAVIAVATVSGWLYAQEAKQKGKQADGSGTAAASDDEKLQHVPTITDIKLRIQTSAPPILVVTATGEVPTSGWSKVQLLRRVYVKPPADGIWEYDLLALKPTGVVAQVITPVSASDPWKDYDTSIKGVRVYGIGRGVKEVTVP